MAGNKKQKSSNGRKFENNEEDYIKISKKHIYIAITFLLVSLICYQLDQKYGFLKKTKNLVVEEEKSNPLKEHVDTSKATADFVKPYIESEFHPNPNVRNLPADLSKWPPGEMGKYQ